MAKSKVNTTIVQLQMETGASAQIVDLEGRLAQLEKEFAALKLQCEKYELLEETTSRLEILSKHLRRELDTRSGETVQACDSFIGALRTNNLLMDKFSMLEWLNSSPEVLQVLLFSVAEVFNNSCFEDFADADMNDSQVREMYKKCISLKTVFQTAVVSSKGVKFTCKDCDKVVTISVKDGVSV